MTPCKLLKNSKIGSAYIQEAIKPSNLVIPGVFISQAKSTEEFLYTRIKILQSTDPFV